MGVSITYLNPLPSLNDPATFNSRALDLFAWITGQSANQLLGELADMDAADFFEVQSSPTDTTADTLMKVGAFGLGVAATVPAIVDINASTTPVGNYHYVPETPGLTSLPTGASSNGMIRIDRAFGSSLRQTLTENSGGLIGGTTWSRTYSGTSGWSPWRRHYDNRNIIGTVSQSGGVPTGAIIERGSNANGEYVRFTDGTQICTVDSLATLASGPTTWTFPAAFIYPAPPQRHVVTGNISTTLANALRLIVGGAANGTSINIHAVDTADAQVVANAHLIAVGRWF